MSVEIVGKGTDPHIFVGSADKMVILKVTAGDFVDDSIAFTVAMLISSKEKKDGIDKEGASVGGRGEICSGRKLRSGIN